MKRLDNVIANVDHFTPTDGTLYPFFDLKLSFATLVIVTSNKQNILLLCLVYDHFLLYHP